MNAERNLVVVTMGSDSDIPAMRPAAQVLDEFGVSHSMMVASAHRSPGFLRRLVARAEKNGVRIFIAGAGGAAHLAGAIAAQTSKPVLGVPLGSKLSGLDSLLSTVQMPKGVPVATLAIDGAANAALLAVEILALSDERLAKRLKSYRRDLEAAVMRKARASGKA